MNTLLYCQEKAAPVGSSHYYARLFYPEQTRHALIAFDAFCQEVSEVPKECSDIGLARIKLEWWRNEMRKISEKNTPEHPISLALAQCDIKDIEPWLGFIDGIEITLDQNRFMDKADLMRYIDAIGGNMGIMAGQLTNTNTSHSEFCQMIGQAIFKGKLLRDIGKDARNGNVYIAIDQLKKHDLNVANIINSKQPSAFASLQNELTKDINEQFKNALTLIPTAEQKKYLYLIVLARLQLAALHEIKINKVDILNNEVQITPLRKFGLSWWTKMTSGKNLARLLG